jgi:hypothetical protein
MQDDQQTAAAPHEPGIVEQGLGRAVDRRAILSGAPAAALGIGAMVLPTAAAALSPGTQGGSTTFGVVATVAPADDGTPLVEGNATLNRSFAHSGRRYYLDTANYELFEFSSAGAFLQRITIDNAPSGRSKANPTSFLVVGDAAYIAMTRDVDVSGTLKPHLSVMRIPLSPAPTVSVTVSYWDVDLLASGLWGTRSIGETNYSDIAADGTEPVSALTVDGDGVLRCVLNSAAPFNASPQTFYTDLFTIPADFSSSPAPVELYASTTARPFRTSPVNAATVGEFSIFFGYDTNSNAGLRVPASPGNWTPITVPRPNGYSDVHIYSNSPRDRSIIPVGSELWALTEFYRPVPEPGSAGVAGLMRLDLGATSVTAAENPSIPVTAVFEFLGDNTAVGFAFATDGTRLYASYFDSNGFGVARIALNGPDGPVVEGTVTIPTSSTMQGIESGALAATQSRTFVTLGNVPA